MKQIPVSKLEGPLLAEFVARVQKWYEDSDFCWYSEEGEFKHLIEDYRPDINGGQAMELARKYSMIVHFGSFKAWLPDYSGGIQCGETPEIAICRVVVASQFGEYVEVSDGN